MPSLDEITKPNTIMLIEAAQRLGIEVIPINTDRQFLELEFKYQGKSHLIKRRSFGINQTQAIRISKDKSLTNQALKNLPVSLPQEYPVSTMNDLTNLKSLTYPVVIKPTIGEKGKGIFVGIQSKKELRKLAKKLFSKYEKLLIQNLIPGINYRVTLLDKQVIGLSKRLPPQLIGDGDHTVLELIELHNQKVIENNTPTHLQNVIKLSQETLWHITNQGKNLDTILDNNERFTPFPVANFQTGGTVETIDTILLPDTVLQLFTQIQQAIGLTFCGLDVICDGDITKLTPEQIFLIEVNSDPSLRLHDRPNQGKNQHTNETLLKFIFDST